MQKFYQIPTYDYQPISHYKAYLFADFLKISNFIALNIDKKLRDILAEPITGVSTIDWYSNHRSLRPLEVLSTKEQETALIIYWEVIENVKKKILELKNSKDSNKLDWAVILEKVFDHENNIVFSNGTDIAIVWGYNFFNNNNYRPNILDKEKTTESFNSDHHIKNSNELEPISISDRPENNDINTIEIPKDKKTENKTTELKETIPNNFLEFLKWFASKYWWYLILLLLLLIILLLIKVYIDHINYISINDSIRRIQNYLNRCCHR